MTIELHNFGPIKYFKFDLDRDLHAIFGKNNIGKSYALSAVYLLLKGLTSYRSERVRYFESEEFYYFYGRIFPKSFKEAIDEKIANIGSESISITAECENSLKEIISRDFLIAINQSFNNSFSFDIIQNKYTNRPLKIGIKTNFMSILLEMNDKKDKGLQISSIKMQSDISIKKLNTNRHYRESDSSLTFYYNSKTQAINQIEQCIGICLQKGLWPNIQNVYFLPASRSGLYNALSTFGAIMAELSQSRTLLRSKIELPNISEPVSDYFLNLSSVRNTKGNAEFADLAKDIEQQILQGKISFNSKTKKFFYQPENLGIELDLSVTSSMISEIAPIVAHLKFILSQREGRRTKSLLFIEEPEAHLHPEIQVKLIEFFVRLIDQNVKVVMTSHSNYIFNKLSNLIIGKKVDANRLSISLMKMGKEGSEAQKDAMGVDEYGIEDQNFADIAEQLYDERVQLIDELNQKLS
ncbi:hypothetical protein Runsl_0551 [Runella slithyformis DSM 19594]|uniref:Endonuclease GajA/Old nuclease/RecF-like AAA domain-containing protein n=2 Tax=Runella TaxID=105 RepID=A0A7U4E4E8_RUNSL|nr:hypothetical protein Runsl_0551 [Runella slithyformis DSM 19594]